MEVKKQENNTNNELIFIKTDANPDPDKAHVTISEFLNFLKTAYQLQGPVEGILMEGGMYEAVKWLKSKEAEFASKSASLATSDVLLQKSTSEEKEQKTDLKRKTSSCEIDPDSDVLKGKLVEVLSEGLLDSVLPYLVQNTQTLKKSTLPMKLPEKNAHQPALPVSNDRLARRKSTGDAASIASKGILTKSESEVEIHVCDEVKNLKKTFMCDERLLIEKMGYFAEVTLGQKLEDMDISVHCDINIFEWLMQWVKKDALLEADWPQLDSQCVIPILVSAAFLQMEPLLQDCLLYCHEHMNEILRTSTNLSCLNDSVLTRLAAMYTNTEVECIKDRKDKIQSRLFVKLIQSLGEPEPESVRGHWCSLARIFRCEKCQQLITPHVAAKIPCVPSCMRLQPDGCIVSLHIRDQAWNINDYIVKLHDSLKTWRKVYWRLWGDAHFLYCTVCKRYFPANQIGWCQYHPDAPQFFTLDAQKAPLPIGRYPCCGERAYRFQLLENYSACQFRQHCVGIEDVRQSAISTMLERRLVARDVNPSSEKFICKETFWWDGFEIVPPRPTMGLLTSFASRTGAGDVESVSSDESTTEENTEEETASSNSLESEEGSAESNPPPKKTLIKKSKKRGNGKLWQHNLSARSNQDIQRAYEESMLKEMAAILNKKMLNEGPRNSKLIQRSNGTLGGLWMRLEAEWRESLNQKEMLLKPKNVNPVRMNKPRSKF